jgi:hypothetical protein
MLALLRTEMLGLSGHTYWVYEGADLNQKPCNAAESLQKYEHAYVFVCMYVVCMYVCMY